MLTNRRRARWARMGGGAAMAIVLVVGLVLNIRLQREARKIQVSPAQEVSLLRSQIVQTAHTVEAAKSLVDEAVYTEAKKRVLSAARVYNILLGHYERYGSIAGSEKQQVVALLAAAARTVADEIARKKLTKRGLEANGNER